MSENLDALPALFWGTFVLNSRKKRRLARWRSETLAYRRVALTRRPRHVAQPRQEGQTRVRARHRTRHRRGPGLWLAVHAAHHASRARARGVLVPAPRRRRHGTPRPEHCALHLHASAQPRARCHGALSRARSSPDDTGCPRRARGLAAAAAWKRRDLLFFRRFAAPRALAGFSLVRFSRFSNARRQAASVDVK